MGRGDREHAGGTARKRDSGAPEILRPNGAQSSVLSTKPDVTSAEAGSFAGDACHDGFTLNDLVSYSQKHNEANGEHNRDGTDHNVSWNCGVAGPSDDPAVEALRNRQIKNFLVLNVLAPGTPMLLMGDEVRHSYTVPARTVVLLAMHDTLAPEISA